MLVRLLFSSFSQPFQWFESHSQFFHFQQLSLKMKIYFTSILLIGIRTIYLLSSWPKKRRIAWFVSHEHKNSRKIMWIWRCHRNYVERQNRNGHGGQGKRNCWVKKNLTYDLSVEKCRSSEAMKEHQAKMSKTRDINELVKMKLLRRSLFVNEHQTTLM